MTTLATVGFAVTLMLPRAPSAPQPAGIPALAIEYADGRRSVIALSATGRVSWTASFPRIAGAETSRDGLPLFAMQYEEARERDGVAVTVALLYGKPYERRVPVETVHVTGAPVRVGALEAFGVRPVVFSIVSLPPAALTLPAAMSVSSGLEIAMETVTDPVPGYLATITNHDSRDVMMLAFKTYRGQMVAMSGRPRGEGRTALIPAGGTYVMKLRASADSRPVPGASGWLPLDRLEITSVLWSDDAVEGDAATAADEHALDAGTALQLDRILALLRAAEKSPASHGPADLRAGIAALPLVVTSEETEAAAAVIPGSVRLPVATVHRTMADGMRNARSAVLNDLDEMLKATPSPAPQDYAAWLARTLAKYAGWRRRIGT
jgi:hypothetical protein